MQFTLEHTDFMDYVFSSRNVKYSDLNYNALVGGVTNWLNNLAQSNRQMDIDHDWSLSLQVSSTTNVSCGFEDPLLNMDDDFIPEIQEDCNSNHLAVSVPLLAENLHSDILPGGSNEEERLLFGDVTDDEDNDGDVNDSEDDDYFDEDNGTCDVLQNNVALNTFLDNELTSSNFLRDYYELADVSSTGL